MGSITLTRSDGPRSPSAGTRSADATKYHALYQADGAGDWLPPITDYQNITDTGFTFNVDNDKSYVVGVRAGNSRRLGALGPTPPPAALTRRPRPTPTPASSCRTATATPLPPCPCPEGGEASYQVMLATKPAADTKVCIGLSVRDNDDGDITFKGQASDVVALDLTFTPGQLERARRR